jgi:hypothetical protein
MRMNRTTRLGRAAGLSAVAVFLVVGAAFGSDALTRRPISAFAPVLANQSALNAEPTETPEATTGIAVTELSDVTTGGTGRSDAVDSTTGTSGDLEDQQGDSSAGTDVEQHADCATGTSGDLEDQQGDSSAGTDVEQHGDCTTGTSVDRSGDVQAEHQSGPQGNDGAGSDVEKQVAGGDSQQSSGHAGSGGDSHRSEGDDGSRGGDSSGQGD